MKMTVPGFRLGDVVRAKVVDVIPPEHFIIEFYGDLLRVKNQSRRRLKKGQSIQLRVRAVQPLEFQVLST
jgi:hypothetical protein